MCTHILQEGVLRVRVSKATGIRGACELLLRLPLWRELSPLLGIEVGGAVNWTKDTSTAQ